MKRFILNRGFCYIYFLLIFMPSYTYANNIVINSGSTIDYEIAGNGQTGSGARPFSGSPNNNRVTVEEGATVSSYTYGSCIDGSVPAIVGDTANYNSLVIKGTATAWVQGVFIGTDSFTFGGEATYNTVEVSGFVDSAYVLGVNIWGYGYVANNTVDISGVVDSSIHGVNIISGTAIGNIVTVSGKTGYSNVVGAYIRQTGEAVSNGVIVSTGGIISYKVTSSYYVHGAFADLGLLRNNFVKIYGTANNSDVYGAEVNVGTATSNYVEIFGNLEESAYGAKVSTGIAINNSVSVFETGIVKEQVFGARVSVQGNAQNNTVSIFGTVGGNVYGSWVDRGTATNNTVIVHSSANISGSIFGSFVGSHGGNAINNTIFIYEDTRLSPQGVLYGGGGSGDVFSGNTLEIYAKNIQVYGINNFEFYNFYFPKNIKTGDIIISAVAGNGASIIAGSNGVIDLSNTNVNVKFQDYVPILNQGDKFYLIVSSGSGTGIINKPVNKVDNIKGMHGATVLYDYGFNLNTTNTELILEVEDAKFDLNPQTKSCLESRVSEMIFIDRGLDLIAEKGIREAADSISSNYVNNLDSYGIAGAFGVITDGSLKYGGDDVKVKGIAIIAGMAKEYRPADKKLVLGCFLEHGKGEYTIKQSYNKNTILGNMSGITEAKGKPQYMGIGILGRFGLWSVKDETGKITDEIYLDGSAKIGKMDSSYHSNSNAESQEEVNFDINGTYYGGHLGFGYVKDLGVLDLEGSFRWMYVRQESKEAKLVTKDTIDFGEVTSSRLKVGARSGFKLSQFVMPFIGLGAEYETQGEVTAKTFIFEIDPEDLGGWSETLELGIKIESGSFRMELSGEAFVGKKEGLVGLLRLAYLI